MNIERGTDIRMVDVFGQDFLKKSDSSFYGVSDSCGGKVPERDTGSGGNSRSVSLASISSDGSLPESHVVEQEDIVTLTHDVRGFKDALGKLRRVFHPERDKSETLRVSAHEKLAELLNILKNILDKYPPLKSKELFLAGKHLIQEIKAFNYTQEPPNPVEFFEAIDQLALAFSSRVSEYLMGDLDSSVSQSSGKSKSGDTPEAAEVIRRRPEESSGGGGGGGGGSESLTPQQLDAVLLRLQQGVEYALHRAKLWSKYAKDVASYVERRAGLEADYAKSIIKLANAMRPILTEESFLPFQSIYCTALDQDIDNSKTCQATCNLLLGQKFLEPLQSRRAEHERSRKALKELWQREMKRTQEAVENFRRAKALYRQRQQDYQRAREQLRVLQQEQIDQARLDKKRKLEDEALQKAQEAETTYKMCVAEANERHLALQKVKAEVLKQVRELMYQCDQTMKAVTVAYFQLQHTATAPYPVQFQTLCESGRLYEPGSQYMEFVKRLPQPPPTTADNTVSPYLFEPFQSEKSLIDQPRKSSGSLEGSEDSSHNTSAQGSSRGTPMRAWGSVNPGSSDTDSISSCQSAPSQDTSPPGSPILEQRRIIPPSSGDEQYQGYNEHVAGGTPNLSKAAVTHTFRKLITPSRCRECDSYVYFQGAECTECGLSCHKKCLETLAIQCGHKRLPRKMTTFGVDLSQHLQETQAQIPHLVCKCVAEIDRRGTTVKGIYRMSGVKSKVEKLCQSFENGADLVDVTDTHPNVIANVLKLYLRQLPEPLLTFKLYQEFIRIAKECPSNTTPNLKSSVTDLRDLCRKLPKDHCHTLAFLMHHLKRVSTESENNNMPPSNLGIVFGPTLLRTPEGSASLSSLVDTVHQTRAISMLITFAEEIFGPPESVLPKDYNSRYRSDAEPAGLWGKASGLMRSLSTSGGSATAPRRTKDGEIVSSTVDRRPPECQEEAPLPGYLPPHKDAHSLSEEELSQSTEDLALMTLDDELPDALLPDDSTPKKSPLIPRQPTSTQPVRPSELIQEKSRRIGTTTKPSQQPSRVLKSNSGVTIYDGVKRGDAPKLSEGPKCGEGPKLSEGPKCGEGPKLSEGRGEGPKPYPRRRSPSTKPLESPIDSDQSFDTSAFDRLSITSETALKNDDPLLLCRLSRTNRARLSGRSLDEDIQVPTPTSLDNLTSSESSQEVESLHTTEDSQSSEFAEDEDGMEKKTNLGALSCLQLTTKCRDGSLPHYVSPYLSSGQQGSYQLGSSLLCHQSAFTVSCASETVKGSNTVHSVEDVKKVSESVKSSLVEDQNKRVAQAFAGRLPLWPEKESGGGPVTGVTQLKSHVHCSLTNIDSSSFQPLDSSRLPSGDSRTEVKRVSESRQRVLSESRTVICEQQTREPQFV